MSLARSICLLVPILSCFIGQGQTDNPYHLNGSAYQETCNCYTLTPDAFNAAGSVWNINKINLSEPFDFKFNLFLGCADGDGADGIAFVLQPISTSIGSIGGGLGYDGISPSIGILVDTWQNFEDNDPVGDHIAIHKNGIIDHSPITDVAQPMDALASGANIEDCQWHILRITWDPVTKLLKTQIDGVDRVQATIDMVRDIFQGDNLVYWGFTSATGGAKNHQRVCTSLEPKFIFPEGQETCFPATINFIDSSLSFGKIVKWMWDFGDGETSESPTPPPHQYAKPGIYEAKLQIVGNNGCLSEPFVKTIVMGTEPVPGFTYAPFPVCEGTPTTFTDSSYVEFGNINQWTWKIGTAIFTDEKPPPQNLTGTTHIELEVKTLEGCESGMVMADLTAYPVPKVDFELNNICLTEPAIFKASNLDLTVPVTQWYWNLGDGVSRLSASPILNYNYRNGGDYPVQLMAISNEGCPSETIDKSIRVIATNAFAGYDTIVAQGQPLQLSASGGDLYQWTPSFGLSASNIANPVATLNASASYVLTASATEGCATSDTINIKVYKGPSFYVPSAFSPNRDGHNDEFKYVAVGMSSIDLFQVFNRFGQMVYSSKGNTRGWDGSFAGVLQPSGTYVWTIRGVDYTGAQHFKKGTVVLLR